MRDWPARFPHGGPGARAGADDRHRDGARQATRERARELRDRVVDLAFERGLLVLGAGENTVRLCPPLVITREQMRFRGGDAGRVFDRGGVG